MVTLQGGGMRRWNLLSILLVAALACGGGEEAEPEGAVDDQSTTQTQEPPPATGETAPVPEQQSPPATTQRTTTAAAPRQAAVAMPLMDEPWTPTDTGTVTPGMTREQVEGVWGVPVTERTLGTWTYLYYRNGCEASCGTFDVVFLENGQVVNAIVRGRGHTYAGTSTSPPGSVAKPTMPGGTEG
jgi:hypothetical protein